MRSSTYQQGKRLAESDIYSAEDACPICSDSAPRRAVATIQREPSITLLQCSRCFGCSASHMPTPEALDRYYGSYYDHVEKERITFHKPIRLARRIASNIDVRGVDHVKILDFGGGDGTIATLVASLLLGDEDRRVSIQVVDYADGSPRRDGSVELEFLDDLNKVAEPYDIVIASAVLEHIPNLSSVMPELIGKLRPGGYFYARTPYVLPYMRMMNMDMTYPGHVHDLGHRFWGSVPSWFPLPLDVVRSGTTPVESSFSGNFTRTLAAHLLKFPSRVESLWTDRPWFSLYGGWEVVMRRREESATA